MTTLLPIEGPLISGSELMLMSQNGPSFSVLSTYPPPAGGGNLPFLFFDETTMSNIANLNVGGPISPAFFKLGSATNGTITLTGLNSSGSAAWGLSSTLGTTGASGTLVPAGTATLPENLTALQTTYAKWNLPALLLASAGYSFNNPQGNTLYFYSGYEDSTAPGGVTLYSNPSTWVSQNILAVPLEVIFGCASGNSTDNCPSGGCDPAVPLCSLYCGILPDDNICTGATGGTGAAGCSGLIQVPSWTNQTDCANGVSYNYCTVGTVCTANCNGPCRSTSEVCHFNTSSQTFGCQFSPNNLFTGQWWKQPWFLITIGIVGFLLLVLVIVGIMATMKRKSGGGATAGK